MVKTLKGSHFDIRVQPSDTRKTSATGESSSATQGLNQCCNWHRKSNNRVPADAYGQTASNLVAGGDIEPVVQQLMIMGGGNWGKDAVLHALHAAYATHSMLWNICIPYVIEASFSILGCDQAVRMIEMILCISCVGAFLLWQKLLFQLVIFLQLKHLVKIQWNQLQLGPHYSLEYQILHL